MRCVKCDGCVVLDGGERRCLNCGARPDLALRMAEPDAVVDRCKYSKRCEEPRAAGRLMCRRHLGIVNKRVKAYQARMREAHQ